MLKVCSKIIMNSQSEHKTSAILDFPKVTNLYILDWNVPFAKKAYCVLTTFCTFPHALTLIALLWVFQLLAGLDFATRGVANATSFYSVVTKFSPGCRPGPQDRWLSSLGKCTLMIICYSLQNQRIANGFANVLTFCPTALMVCLNVLTICLNDFFQHS